MLWLSRLSSSGAWLHFPSFARWPAPRPQAFQMPDLAARSWCKQHFNMWESKPVSAGEGQLHDCERHPLSAEPASWSPSARVLWPSISQSPPCPKMPVHFLPCFEALPSFSLHDPLAHLPRASARVWEQKMIENNNWGMKDAYSFYTLLLKHFPTLNTDT